jgi:hypothetical protein
VNIVSLLFVLSLALLPISCDTDGTDGNDYTGPWQEVPTPGGEGYLNACYFNSPNDGWACGHDGTGQGKMIFLHWDGVGWKEYEYPGWFDAYGTVTSIDIADVFFIAPDDGWAVGFVSFENDDFFGFVLRYDGVGWYLFETEVSFYKIYGIATNDVWFLTGSYDSDMYHWNGTEFEYYNLYPGNYGLRALAFGSPTEGLAIGDYRFIYHWDGVTWNLITYDAGTMLTDVAYDTPTTAWIAGDYAIRWENGDYHILYNSDAWFGYVHFSSPDEGWMVGNESTEEHPYPYSEGFTWHWNGVQWTRIDIPEDMKDWDIFSIDYDNAWIVGQNSSIGQCCSWRYVPTN